jgi:hypothetical protein
MTRPALAPNLPPFTSFALAAALALLSGCKDKTDPTGTGDGGTAPVDPITLALTPERVEIRPMTPIGPQPGFVDGGLVYVVMNVGEVQSFLQSLPLPSDVVRDLAEVGSELGFDPRVDDLRRRFALADDARVSMTLLRPLGRNAASVRADLARGGPLLEAWASGGSTPTEKPIERVLVEPAPPAEVAVPKEAVPPAAPAEEKAAPPSTGGSFDIEPISPPPEPPPELPPPEPPKPVLSPEIVREADAARGRASTLALHFRFHVPVTDPAPLRDDLRRISRSDAESSRARELCRTVARASLCMADDDYAFVVREEDHAHVLDIVVFTAPSKREDGQQLAIVREALAAPPAALPALAELGGDAAAYLHAPAIVGVTEVVALGQAARSLEWSTPDSRGETVDRRLRQLDAVERMSQSTVLFDGLQLEADRDGERLQAVLRWRARAESRATAESIFVGAPVRAKVPTLAALCEGAIACARTRGLPRPSTFAEALATGVWAEDQRALENRLDAGDEMAALQLFVSTWPNLLAAATRWPEQEIGRGPEAALARSVVDAVGRIEGFGASLRSLSADRRRVQMGYVVYLRALAQDVAMLRGFARMAGLQPSETTVAGVEGVVDIVRVPENDVPAVLLIRTDPDKVEVEGKPTDYGWAVVADGTDRLAWLLGLARDDGQGPAAYLEIPDALPLVTGIRDVDEELSFARTWLGGRSFRFALYIDGGEPRIAAVMDRKAK